MNQSIVETSRWVVEHNKTFLVEIQYFFVFFFSLLNGVALTWYGSRELVPLHKVHVDPGGGGGTAIYGLYRDVPL